MRYDLALRLTDTRTDVRTNNNAERCHVTSAPHISSVTYLSTKQPASQISASATKIIQLSTKQFGCTRETRLQYIGQCVNALR